MNAHFLCNHRRYTYLLAALLFAIAAALKAWAGEPVLTNDIPERATLGVVDPLLPLKIEVFNGFRHGVWEGTNTIGAEDVSAPDEPRRSSRWPAFREAMFAKYGTACWWCGATNNPTLDHVTPFNDAPHLELVETNVWVCCDGPTINGHKYRRFGCHWKIGHGGKDWKYHSPGWVIRTVGWGSNAVGRVVQEARRGK